MAIYPTGVLVPAYFDAYGAAYKPAWKALADAANVMGPKLIVIVNPEDGPIARTAVAHGNNYREKLTPAGQNHPDGTAGTGEWFDEYAACIKEIRDNGGKVVGYVEGDNGNRRGAVTEDGVLRDIKYWFDWYGNPTISGTGIDGIFIDEASSAWPYPNQHFSYFDGLYGTVAQRDPSALIIYNFGQIPTSAHDAQVGSPPRKMTIMDYPNLAQAMHVVYEGTWDKFDNQWATKDSDQKWIDSAISSSPEQFATLFHSTNTATLPFLRVNDLSIGWTFVTQETMPNPWGKPTDFLLLMETWIRLPGLSYVLWSLLSVPSRFWRSVFGGSWWRRFGLDRKLRKHP